MYGRSWRPTARRRLLWNSTTVILPNGSARSGKSAGQPKKNGMRRPKRKASVISSDGCRRRAEHKSQSAKPTTWNDSLTLKTTPQASCGAYIKNAPCGFIPQGAGYMDLSAVFSLAAVNGCAGQSSARKQQYRNPKGDIAVVAGLRRSGIAGLAVIWLIGICRRSRCGFLFHEQPH